uniref:C-type lectin domain-containing protein n=2 Tax=Stomoxys calcitrans TaxID=35570 RepID=A0A1I8QCD3_STOCA
MMTIIPLLLFGILIHGSGGERPKTWQVKLKPKGDTFWNLKWIVFYLETETKMTHRDAELRCLKKNMMLANNDWELLNKTLSIQDMRFMKLPLIAGGWSNTNYKSLFICWAALMGVYIVDTNGSHKYLDTSRYSVPAPCYPQKDLSFEDYNQHDITHCLF